MEKLVINGPTRLKGDVNISGAKNAAVAIIPATLLIDGECTLENVPNISDVKLSCTILEKLGAKITWLTENSLKIDTRKITSTRAPLDITSKFRASYYLIGSLLSRCGKAEVGLPGGCKLGARPIDQHIKGFEALGANTTVAQGKIIAEADRLVGTSIYMDTVSVGATINVMLAAVLAEGITTIDNAAKEPHIVNVATFLNNMGAKITGAGTSEIKIEGVDYLHSCFHEVVPDYIETGTYMILASIIGDKLKISNIIPDHVESLISKLEDVGAIMEIGVDFITISRPKKLKATNIKTQVYPGFPTDLQQPMATLLTQANGKSIINETIWENRFLNLKELNKMGATTDLLTNQKAVIIGPTKLTGKRIKATDLRGAASLLIAGLIASGTTVIENADYILRGYEDIVYKLTNVGADIKLEKEG